MKMKPKGGMTGGKQPKATEMGTESNKQYVKRMFSMGMNTKMTNDKPMENKGYAAGKKVMMRAKSGASGGKNTKRMMKTKGGMRGGPRRMMKNGGKAMKSKGMKRGGKAKR